MAYCTALVKTILAFLPSAEIDAYITTTRLNRNGPNTITSKKDLLKELNGIRNTGTAVNDEEAAIGLRCVAAPIFDHTGRPVYSISVSGPIIW